MSGRQHLPLLALLALYAATGLAGHGNLWMVALAPPLIWASLTDLDRQVIPDAASAFVAMLGLAHPLWAGRWPDTLTLALALVLVLVLGLFGEVYWRRRGAEALGLGDVKLIGAGVLVVGAAQAWLTILLAACGGIIAALSQGKQGEKGIPFGPFLAYAIFLVATFAGMGARI